MNDSLTVTQTLLLVRDYLNRCERTSALATLSSLDRTFLDAPLRASVETLQRHMSDARETVAYLHGFSEALVGRVALAEQACYEIDMLRNVLAGFDVNELLHVDETDDHDGPKTLNEVRSSSVATLLGAEARSLERYAQALQRAIWFAHLNADDDVRESYTLGAGPFEFMVR